MTTTEVRQIFDTSLIQRYRHGETKALIIACHNTECQQSIIIGEWGKDEAQKHGWLRYYYDLWYCPTHAAPILQKRADYDHMEQERQAQMKALIAQPHDVPMNRTQAIAIKRAIVDLWRWDNNPIQIKQLPDGHWGIYDPDCDETWEHLQSFLDYAASQCD